MATAFGTLGAVNPSVSSQISNFMPSFGSSPQSSALSAMKSPQIPAPTTPVKKINNADGSSTEFHAPASNGTYGGTAALPTQYNYNSQTGQSTPTGTTFSTTGNSGTTGIFPTPPVTPTPPTPPFNASVQGSGTQPGLLTYGQGNANNPIVGNASSGLMGIGQNQTPAVKAAYDKLQSDIGQLTSLQGGVNKGFGTGEQQVLQNIVQGDQNAYNAAITGEGQQTTALSNAGTLGGQQQQQNIGALGTAGQLTQPQLGQYGQTYYQPTNAGQGAGQITPGSDMDTALNQYAQMAANGQISAIPSSITSNPVLNAELNKRATAINPKYNPVASAAQGGVITSQTQQVEAYKSARQQGQALQSQLSDLITTFGLNPSDINAANAGLQKIAQNTSSSQYKILSNYVNDIANTYAQILTPAGGSQTDTTRSLASSMLDATASGQSIQDVMKSLDTAAQAKIAKTQTIGAGTSDTSGNTWNDIFGQ